MKFSRQKTIIKILPIMMVSAICLGAAYSSEILTTTPTITYADTVKDTDKVKDSDFDSDWWKLEVARITKKPFNTVTYGDLKKITSISPSNTASIPINYVNVPIPTGIKYMTNLQSISFIGEGAVGDIPDIFQDLTKLTSISMSGVNITGVFPDSLLTNKPLLKSFYFKWLDVSGELPESVRELTNLQEFMVYSTKLSGNVETLFQDLPNLVELGLGGSKFTGQLPKISTNKLIKYYMWDNDFEGQIPVQALHGKMVDLNVAENPKVYGTIPPNTFTNVLKYFYVNNTSMSGTIDNRAVATLNKDNGSVANSYISLNTNQVYELKFKNYLNSLSYTALSVQDLKFLVAGDVVSSDKIKLNTLLSLENRHSNKKYPFVKGMRITFEDSTGNKLMTIDDPETNPVIPIEKLKLNPNAETVITAYVGDIKLVPNANTTAKIVFKVMPKTDNSNLFTSLVGGPLSLRFEEKDASVKFGEINLDADSVTIEKPFPSIVVNDTRGTHSGYDIQLAIGHLTSGVNTLQSDIYNIDTFSNSHEIEYGGTVTGVAKNTKVREIPRTIYTANKNNGQGYRVLKSDGQKIRLTLNPNELRVDSSNLNSYSNVATLSIVPKI